MLLQEHGRQYDQSRQYIGSRTYRSVLLQPFAFIYRYTDTSAEFKYMKAWEYIGACIRPVEHPDHIHEDVISLEHTA